MRPVRSFRPVRGLTPPGRPPACVHVLVPAHNEEQSIGATLVSLRRQTVRPTTVTVIADNCTDYTAGAAIIEGATVFTTVNNREKKAGALNQYLRRELLAMSPDDLILVMDADSALDPRFLEAAVARLRINPQLGAVGGVFKGQRAVTNIQQVQANEYVRYARAVGRRQGRVMVLTGTATVFRAGALLQVAEQRGQSLPGEMGNIYDTTALTEDNEITLALKHLGWQMLSPRECVVYTDLMPTVGDLHRQRLRWYRGAVENLLSYGWTPVTKRYWLQQLGLLACTLLFLLFIAVTAIDLSLGILRFSPWWSAVSLVFLVERLVTVWRVGTRRGRVLALLLVPEAAYDLLLQFTFVRGAYHVARKTPAQWSAEPPDRFADPVAHSDPARPTKGPHRRHTEMENHVPAQTRRPRREDQRRGGRARRSRLHRA
jgi:biofilm PGA synthesis N-glycosyltransferase PgaC